MVTVEDITLLSDIRKQERWDGFHAEELEAIESAIEAVPEDVFHDAETGAELKRFDELIAENLPQYHHEHDAASGRNPACKLWDDRGFDYSVDLYHDDMRVAIEIEKSERKRISDDILKFVIGGKSQRNKRKRIENGCLIVPVNYRGSDNLYVGAVRILEFVRSVLFVEDIAVIGYRDPRD